MARQPTHSTPQRVPEGFLLTANLQDGRKGLYALIFGLFWITFTSLMLAFVLTEGSWLAITIPLIFLIGFETIGLFIVGASLLEIWASLKLEAAELILPSYPLRLGETSSIYYRRRLKKGTFSQPGNIEARLICDEWVQYTQGTDTKTKTYNLHEAQLPTRTVVTGERQADYESSIVIPTKEAPSFSAQHNKIRWRIEIKLKVPNIPHKCQSKFFLQVVPEVLTQP